MKKKVDIKARNYISNSLADSQLDLVMDQQTTYGMWKKLNGVYSRENKSLQILAEHELPAFKYKSNKESRSKFVSKFELQLQKSDLLVKC